MVKEFNMKRSQSENGAIMVEAAIYFPLVLCTVVALLYYGLFRYQESAMLFQVNRVAMNCAREAAYPGYGEFEYSTGNRIDFDWTGNTPPDAAVQQYYETYFEDLSVLYRGMTGYEGASATEYTSQLRTYLNQTNLFSFGSYVSPNVEIKSNILETKISVEATFKVASPGVLKYMGITDDIAIRTKAYAYSMNPTEFVRNVDLAVDLIQFVLEKLGFSGQVDAFIAKACEIRDLIL